MRAVPRLCKLYPGICLTTEEKARKKPQSGQPKNASWHNENNIQNTAYITIRIHKHNSKNIKLGFFIHQRLTVTLASTSNALPHEGVTEPKHVRAVLT